MNKDELEGGARRVGGRIEQAVGDATESAEWTVDGVIDQVAGGVQQKYGNARSIAGDAVDSASELADESRDRLKAAGETMADSARKNSKVAAQAMRDQLVLWMLAAAAVGYGLAWLIYVRRD